MCGVSGVEVWMEGYEFGGEQVGTAKLVYEPNPKHKPIPTPGRHGSICPPHADGPGLLSVSDLYNSKRYATDGADAYCAHRHDVERNAWHGFPIGWDEVPPALVSRWVLADKVDRRTVRRAKRRRDR
jgi:hypothetical protein